MSEKRLLTHGKELWQRGTRGVLSPDHTDRAALIDMRQYPDGGLGPRPRWKRYGQTAVGGARRYGSAPDDALQFMQQNVLGTERYGLLVVGGTETNFHWLQQAVGVPPVHQSLLTPVSAPRTASRENTHFITRIASQSWLIDGQVFTLDGLDFNTIGVADCVGALTVRFGLTGLVFALTGSAVHQGRAFFSGRALSALGGGVTGANRVYYSDAQDFAVFTSASQFFDVDGTISGLASTGNNLLIWTRDGTWYVLQGRGNPANGTLTKLGRGPVPHPLSVSANLRDTLVYQREGLHGMVMVGPGGALEDGAAAHLAFEAAPISYTRPIAGAVASSRHAVLLVPGDYGDPTQLKSPGPPRAFHMNAGSWASETWSGFAGLSGEDRRFQVGLDEDLGTEALFVWNQAGPGWEVYTRPMTVSAPPADVVGDPYAEDPAGQVELPRISEPDSQSRVLRVIADVRYWSGTGYGAPSMGVRVLDGRGDTTALIQGPAAAALASLPAASGASVRLVYTPDAMLPYTHLSDVSLFDIRNIVVDRVTVEVETISRGPIQ